MRRLVIITGARSEYGVLRPLLRLARGSTVFDLRLVVAGMHWSKEHGETWREIEADGFAIEYRVGMEPRGDGETGCGQADPLLRAETISKSLMGFAAAYGDCRPDMVLVEGDRVEALAATLAAGYMGIPIAHSGGGCITGTIDNAARHAISHFASLHFVETEDARQRLERMGVGGEIHVVGGLGIDALMQVEEWTRERTLAELGLPAGSRYLLVGFHPESECPERSRQRMVDLLNAADSTDRELVITYPNGDPGSEGIIEAINDLENELTDSYALPDTWAVFPSLGSVRYLNALRHADALVGNSSSGLLEAPSLRVPVVNVGHRQDGRLKAGNVLDCGYGYEAICQALTTVLDDETWRAGLGSVVNPHGDGHAAERMMRVIERRLGE